MMPQEIREKMERLAERYAKELAQISVELIAQDDWKMLSIINKTKHIESLSKDLETELVENRKHLLRISSLETALKGIIEDMECENTDSYHGFTNEKWDDLMTYVKTKAIKTAREALGSKWDDGE